MPIVSSGALMDDLRRYGLLSPEHLSELPHLFRGRCHQAQPLAKLLGQRGWLTIFQINEILAGNAKNLVVGPYRVLERLGQGGVSQVFKARHAEDGSVVALKVMRPDVFSDAAGRAQFLVEMEAMALLDHPNIVEFCDADQAGDTFYYAMEYVEGTDLGKLVTLSGPLPVAAACDCIRQTALGLQHAHERNLVHRDIKPANLYVVSNGQIKIIDWGLACFRRPGAAPPPVSVATPMLGTADYLAPEQAANANAVDIRADIYALGCTLYYVLTGRPPFQGESLMEKVMLHRQTEPQPVCRFRDDVPEDLIHILTRMLAKRPQDRYHTPAALAVELAPLLNLAAPTRPRRDLTPLPGHLRRPLRGADDSFVP